MPRKNWEMQHPPNIAIQEVWTIPPGLPVLLKLATWAPLGHMPSWRWENRPHLQLSPIISFSKVQIAAVPHFAPTCCGHPEGRQPNWNQCYRHCPEFQRHYALFYSFWDCWVGFPFHRETVKVWALEFETVIVTKRLKEATTVGERRLPYMVPRLDVTKKSNSLKFSICPCKLTLPTVSRFPVRWNLFPSLTWIKSTIFCIFCWYEIWMGNAFPKGHLQYIKNQSRIQVSWNQILGSSLSDTQKNLYVHPFSLFFISSSSAPSQEPLTRTFAQKRAYPSSGKISSAVLHVRNASRRPHTELLTQAVEGTNPRPPGPRWGSGELCRGYGGCTQAQAVPWNPGAPFWGWKRDGWQVSLQGMGRQRFPEMRIKSQRQEASGGRGVGGETQHLPSLLLCFLVVTVVMTTMMTSVTMAIIIVVI